MARALWLPDVLRAAGLTVVEMAGWQTRGRADISPQGVVAHHTATGSNWSDSNVARLLRDGRPDLTGPLSQLGLRRSGVYDLIAAGRCNHNGYGQWGNDSIGIEAYNDGRGEPWPADQLDAYKRGCAAICRHKGWGADRVKGHKETDPKRKIDPAGIDMHRFRADVTRLLNTNEESFMAALSEDEQRELQKDLREVRDRLRLLTPFPPERIDRKGQRHPPKTPDTVVADPSQRWLIEAVTSLRDLLKR